MCRSFITCVTIFIALKYFTGQVLCQERCFGSRNSCSGQFHDMKAICKDSYCYCTGKDYDYNTCLPDAYGCKIVSNSDSIYTCNPANSSPQYEVHVLAVYEVINRRPPTADYAIVNIISRGKSNRPIVLVLVNYEPVNWVLNIPADIIISKVILVSYYLPESYVSGDVSRVNNVERIGTITNSEWSTGYGSDSGGGETVKILKQVYKRFGVVTSFRGTYKTTLWSLELSPFNETVNSGCRYDHGCGIGQLCCRKEQGQSTCRERSCVGHFCYSSEDCTATGECCVRNKCTTSCIGNECKFDYDCSTGEDCTYPESNCVYNPTGKPCPERSARKCFSSSGCSSASDCDIFGTGYYCCKVTKYSPKRTCSFDCTNAFCSEDSDCAGQGGCCDMTNFKCEECQSHGFPVWVIGALLGILAVILIIAGYVRLRLKRRGMHAQSYQPAQTSPAVPQHMQAMPSRSTENEHGNEQVPDLFVRNIRDENEAVVPSAPPLEPYPSTLTSPPPPSYESMFPNR